MRKRVSKNVSRCHTSASKILARTGHGKRGAPLLPGGKREDLSRAGAGPGLRDCSSTGSSKGSQSTLDGRRRRGSLTRKSSTGCRRSARCRSSLPGETERAAPRVTAGASVTATEALAPREHPLPREKRVESLEVPCLRAPGKGRWPPAPRRTRRGKEVEAQPEPAFRRRRGRNAADGAPRCGFLFCAGLPSLHLRGAAAPGQRASAADAMPPRTRGLLPATKRGGRPPGLSSGPRVAVNSKRNGVPRFPASLCSRTRACAGTAVGAARRAGGEGAEARISARASSEKYLSRKKDAESRSKGRAPRFSARRSPVRSRGRAICLPRSSTRGRSPRTPPGTRRRCGCAPPAPGSSSS